MPHSRLDEIDRKILAELQADGRMTNVELAKRVGISAPPCLRRVRTLGGNRLISAAIMRIIDAARTWDLKFRFSQWLGCKVKLRQTSPLLNALSELAAGARVPHAQRRGGLSSSNALRQICRPSSPF